MFWYLFQTCLLYPHSWVFLVTLASQSVVPSSEKRLVLASSVLHLIWYDSHCQLVELFPLPVVIISINYFAYLHKTSYFVKQYPLPEGKYCSLSNIKTMWLCTISLSKVYNLIYGHLDLCMRQINVCPWSFSKSSNTCLCNIHVLQWICRRQFVY